MHLFTTGELQGADSHILCRRPTVVAVDTEGILGRPNNWPSAQFGCRHSLAVGTGVSVPTVTVGTRLAVGTGESIPTGTLGTKLAVGTG
jgi:hypothetical protein